MAMCPEIGAKGNGESRKKDSPQQAANSLSRDAAFADSTPMTARERHNAICNVTGETLWGFQSSMILPATVLTVLLTQLGASKAMVGLIPSLDGLILFMSIFGIHLFRSHKKRKLRIIVFHYLAMVPLLAAMGALVLAHDSIPRDVLKFLLLGCWAAFMASIGASSSRAGSIGWRICFAGRFAARSPAWPGDARTWQARRVR